MTPQISPAMTAEEIAWNAGARDGFALGLEYGHDDDPDIAYPPMPEFASEGERTAYVDGHITGYVQGSFDAEKEACAGSA